MKKLILIFTRKSDYSPVTLDNFGDYIDSEDFIFVSDQQEAQEVTDLSKIDFQKSNTLILTFRDYLEIKEDQKKYLSEIKNQFSSEIFLGYHRGKGDPSILDFYYKKNLKTLETIFEKINTIRFFSKEKKFQKSLESLITSAVKEFTFTESLKYILAFFEGKIILDTLLETLHKIYFLPRTKRNPDKIKSIVTPFSKNIPENLREEVRVYTRKYTAEQHNDWFLAFREMALKIFKETSPQ